MFLNIDNLKDSHFYFVQFTSRFYKGKIKRVRVSSIEEGMNHIAVIRKDDSDFQFLGIVRVNITLENVLVVEDKEKGE